MSSVRPTEAGVLKPRRVNTRSSPTHRAVKPANRKTAANKDIGVDVEQVDLATLPRLCGNACKIIDELTNQMPSRQHGNPLRRSACHPAGVRM